MNNDILIYLLAVLGSFFLTLVLVPLIRQLALKHGIVDNPGSAERKVHQAPIPLLGGVAIFIACFFWLFIFRFLNLANFSRVPDRYLIGVFIGGLLIAIGGFLDDKYNLRPWQQIIWPIGAALVVLISGIRIGYITNPLGGADNAIIYLAPLAGIIISFVWLLGMMYTMKFLDGLDGLASGIGAIAALMIFLVSLNWDVAMSATGLWSLILMGSGLGFLVFNSHPAKIFLGEGGSVFLGFMLGILSIISGSKITTTLLIVGLPALDVFWVIIQRVWQRQSPFSHADRKHLHYRLLELGFSKRGAVLFLYLVALIFGSLGVISGSFGKLMAFIFLFLSMIVLIVIIYLNNLIRHGQRQTN